MRPRSGLARGRMALAVALSAAAVALASPARSGGDLVRGAVRGRVGVEPMRSNPAGPTPRNPAGPTPFDPAGPTPRNPAAGFVSRVAPFAAAAPGDLGGGFACPAHGLVFSNEGALLEHLTAFDGLPLDGRGLGPGEGAAGGDTGVPPGE